ncbi:MAG: tRNA (adenosine(37)-N6)-threonylcarbamoyltransferase complex dimerization subunit type 1 TsaB [Buchnera aphidicola (Nurudea shiraii)]
MSKNILAFNSSLFCCSISLLYQGNIYNKIKKCNKNQIVHILPMIQTMLKENYIDLHEIEIIAISTGPGNFIGIRTSIAIAQGLSLGLNVPIASFPTPLILAEEAYNTFNKHRIIMIMKTNNKNVYLEKYTKNKDKIWTKKKSKKTFSIQEIYEKLSYLKKTWILVGDIFGIKSTEVHKNLIISNIQFPKSQFIITLYLSNKYYQKYSFSYKIFPRYF